MKVKSLRSCLECVSFLLWILFTILSVALAGLGVEGILFAVFVLAFSTTQPVHFPLVMTAAGGLGVFLSIVWRQVGIDYFHYLQYDSPSFLAGDEEETSHVLQDLIQEVESSSGYARSDARAKAKSWLIAHVSALNEEDILLARAHFGYLLPAGWLYF